MKVTINDVLVIKSATFQTKKGDTLASVQLIEAGEGGSENEFKFLVPLEELTKLPRKFSGNVKGDLEGYVSGYNQGLTLKNIQVKAD